MSESLQAPIDLSPEARLARIAEVLGRMEAGVAIDPREVNPQTHAPELVTLVGQVARHGTDVEL